MVHSSPSGSTGDNTVKARVVVKSSTARKKLIEEVPLDDGEFLVEVTDRITENGASFVQPVDPSAEVVARFLPELRKALFEEGAEMRFKTIYKVRELRGIERTLKAPSGDVVDTRPLNLFVIKRHNP